MGRLVEPKVVVKGVGVDQNQGGAVALDLVPDVDAIGLAVGHRHLEFAKKPAIRPGYTSNSGLGLNRPRAYISTQDDKVICSGSSRTHLDCDGRVGDAGNAHQD